MREFGIVEVFGHVILISGEKSGTITLMVIYLTGNGVLFLAGKELPQKGQQELGFTKEYGR